MEVGASVTLTRLMRFLKEQIATRPKWQTQTFAAVVNQLRCACVFVAVVLAAAGMVFKRCW